MADSKMKSVDEAIKAIKTNNPTFKIKKNNDGEKKIPYCGHEHESDEEDEEKKRERERANLASFIIGRIVTNDEKFFRVLENIPLYQLYLAEIEKEK